MSTDRTDKIRREGAYIVKAAESRPSRANSSANGRTQSSAPSTADRQIARALLKQKRG